MIANKNVALPQAKNKKTTKRSRDRPTAIGCQLGSSRTAAAIVSGASTSVSNARCEGRAVRRDKQRTDAGALPISHPDHAGGLRPNRRPAGCGLTGTNWSTGSSPCYAPNKPNTLTTPASPTSSTTSSRALFDPLSQDQLLVVKRQRLDILRLAGDLPGDERR